MTKEEAKKVLENLKEHTLNYQSGLALDMAISALEDGWIPIEERKPKHKQEVFVTYETEDGIKVDKTVYHERHGFTISSNVTAWREDIKPYKKGE